MVWNLEMRLPKYLSAGAQAAADDAVKLEV